MKYLILLIMTLASGLVMAQSEVCTSSFTVQTVTVASHTATQIDTAARRMPGRKWAELQDISTDTVHCAQSSDVTTTTGRLLTANGGSWAVNLGEGSYAITIATYPTAIERTLIPTGFYCIGSGTNITSKVVLSQCK